MKECNRWSAKRSKVCTDGAEGVCERCWAALDAAPEMLEALAQIVDAYDRGIGVTLPKTSLALARAAIAKAESK